MNDKLITVIDIAPTNPDEIAVWTDYRVRDAVAAIPGAHWNSKERHWALPLSWTAALALRKTFGANPNTQELIVRENLHRWAVAERKRKAAIRALHRALEADLAKTALPGFDALFPYQRVAAEAIRLARAYMLFDQTGTGKSRSSMAGVSLLREDGHDVFPMLLVAPKSMLITWARDEVPRFFPDVKDVRVLQGTPSKVKKAMEPGGQIYVGTYDALRNYSRHAPFPTVKMKPEDKELKELNAIDWSTVVADEVHRAKNPESQQTRALWYLMRNARYRVGLTGSPIQDTVEDLWALLHMIAPDEYPVKTKFLERFTLTDYNDWGGREIIGLNPRTEEEFFENAETRWRRMTKAVALPFLPKKIFEARWVELPPKFRKAYDDMKKTMIAELESGSTLTAKSVLDRATRLTQLANATGEVDADGRFTMTGPSPKVDAFLEDVRAGDYDGSQVVVFSDSRQLIEILHEEMSKKKGRHPEIPHLMITGSVVGDARQEAMDKFQAGEVPFLLLTRAGGEGITLTAADTMVRLVRSWSLIVHNQSEDRVHRIGSERHASIKYVDYITDGTVEVNQLGRLNAKGERAQEVLRDADLLDMLKDHDVSIYPAA